MPCSVRIQLVLVSCLLLTACPSNNTEQIQNPDFTQELAIDIEAVSMGGDFTLNTGNFPVSFSNRGAIYLQDTQNKVLTLLGETWSGNYAGALIIKGNYDSVYGLLNGFLVPRNAQATVATNQQIDMDQALDIDVPRVIVVPTFMVDGSAFPESVYQSADFLLRPTGSKELISMGPTHAQPAGNVMVTPGTYDVIYSIQQGDQLPQNEYAVVMRDVEIMETPHVLDVNLRTLQVGGIWRLAVDGLLGQFPGSAYHYGEFFLRNADGDSVSLGPTAIDEGFVPVIAGTYDLVYTHVAGDMVPQNRDKVILKDLVLTGGLVFQEAIVDAWTVIPAFTLDGGPFPGSVYESGEIFIKDKNTGALTSMGSTHNPPDDLLIIDGTYDAVYQYYSGSTVPQNESVQLYIDVIIDETDEVAGIDVDSVTVEGEFGLNGGSFSQSVYESASFYLYQAGSDSGILLGRTYKDAEPVVIVEGYYNVVYKHYNGSVVPQNPHYVVLFGQNYAVDTVIDLNILTREVRPAFTLNSQPFPMVAYQRGDFYLRGNHSEDRVFLGSSNDPTEKTAVIRGDYDALYQHDEGTTVPLNAEAVVGQVQVD